MAVLFAGAPLVDFFTVSLFVLACTSFLTVVFFSVAFLALVSALALASASFLAFSSASFFALASASAFALRKPFNVSSP